MFSSEMMWVGFIHSRQLGKNPLLLSDKRIKLCGALQLDQHYLMTNDTGSPAAVVCIFIGVNDYFRSVLAVHSETSLIAQCSLLLIFSQDVKW